jgi:CRP-like cAMP-binding protein
MAIDKVAALRRTALFGALSEEELGALAACAVERSLARDELLFVEGDEAQGLFVIVAGAVRAFRSGAGGREQVIHVEGAGATIAELPVFDQKPYPSTVAADEESTVLFLAKREVQLLCLRHPQIPLAALKYLAGRLRECAKLVETLSLRDVDQRLARWLLGEARAGGQPTGAGVEIKLELTNQQIAARIGSVREVVSRALTRLQNKDLIKIDGRRIVIIDEADLASFSDG